MEVQYKEHNPVLGAAIGSVVGAVALGGLILTQQHVQTEDAERAISAGQQLATVALSAFVGGGIGYGMVKQGNENARLKAEEELFGYKAPTSFREQVMKEREEQEQSNLLIRRRR